MPLAEGVYNPVYLFYFKFHLIDYQKYKITFIIFLIVFFYIIYMIIKYKEYKY